MTRALATIILAAGQGSRMGSSEKHKVCFEVAGVPVIWRALETYNLCGARPNIVVVGTLAESVMTTVSRRFPGTIFAFQEVPRGTGHAARQGAQILEQIQFAGDVLVVAGDKVITPRTILQLRAAHEASGADVTLATTRRPPHSSSGILLTSAKKRIVGILEERERQRLVALGRIGEALGRQSALSRPAVERIVTRECEERTARALVAELLSGGPSDLKDLNRNSFEQRFSPEERRGCARVGVEAIPADQILERFDQVNLSAYVFRGPVLQEAMEGLKHFRANHEEYLTDVVEILARRDPPARLTGCEIRDPHDLMAFNNPQELLAIEEVYRPPAEPSANDASGATGGVLERADVWMNRLSEPDGSTRRQFARWYGPAVPWEKWRDVLEAFIRRFGPERRVVIVRSPGRINLMGRHIDHQGGPVNVMAVNREVILVAAPRTDDAVRLVNLNESQFAEQGFRIADLVANLDWDDWQRVIDGPRLQRLLETARGDWVNYAKAAMLRLQEQFRDRPLRGLDLMVSGDIPMGAGLSSSSALVVAVAEAVRVVNGLSLSALRLVSLCGESEWFVGTRGGASDHAAIRLSRRGYVTRVSFFPFRIEGSAPFFPEHDLVVCNSGIYAGKSAGVRNRFNAKVAAYQIGRAWIKLLRPELAPRIEHLCDLTPEHLGMKQTAFARLLAQLPERLTRRQVETALPRLEATERERIQRMLQSHDAPAEGYVVGGVVRFGLAEMERADRCLDLLQNNRASDLGRLMDQSHDGDRVAHETARHVWRTAAWPSLAVASRPSARSRGKTDSVARLPGAYGCSLPALDRIADLARRQTGVEGAQLAGAGLGGCVMVLVQKAHSPALLEALGRWNIMAEVFRPIAGACAI